MQKILFFDGVCNLCNGFVDLLINSPYPGSFAPLQGSTARNILPAPHLEKLSYVVYFRGGELFTGPSAVLKVLEDTGGAYGFLGRVLSFFPAFLGEWFYRFVASNRYRFFGKKDSCRLPSPAEQEKFLP